MFNKTRTTQKDRHESEEFPVYTCIKGDTLAHCTQTSLQNIQRAGRGP